MVKQTQLKTRGRVFRGKVISAKAQKTVTVSWDRRVYVPKFERYMVKSSKVKAHNAIDAKEGDTVIIKECRPLSKTKKFVATEVVKE
jgi:small subunit ribosomal protein S17